MDSFRSESAGSAREDERFMRAALDKACDAEKTGELPVGAVVVLGGEIVAAAANRTEAGGNALSHAEINAIAAACGALGRKTLEGCALYVTLEPCPMCAGAIYHARLDRVVYGTPDAEYGSMGGKFDLFELAGFGSRRPAVTGGVLGEECAAALRRFFAAKRRQPFEMKAF